MDKSAGQNLLPVSNDDNDVQALAGRIKQLEAQLGVANASQEGYPITHYNVYVNGQPIASPDTVQDALAQAAMAKIDSLRQGLGIPFVQVTKRVVGHPHRNDLVTEEEIDV